jgi:plasmid stability protein
VLGVRLTVAKLADELAAASRLRAGRHVRTRAGAA